jgi:hypothetical protein
MIEGFGSVSLINGSGCAIREVQKHGSWNTGFSCQVITEGVELPESNNELRKNQLRELALLNGTLREDGVVVR